MMSAAFFATGLAIGAQKSSMLTGKAASWR